VTVAARPAPRRRSPRSAARLAYRFFGGKGGVGKTTCAAASALAAADAGARVLVVSTDPAHSLGDALGARLSSRPRRLRGAPGGLLAVELDADGALADWLGARRRLLRTIAERGTYLDQADVERFLDLSLPGVDELVGLLELRRLAAAVGPDLVVVDTAPTGHTLRLLAMPATLARIARVLDDMYAKHRFLAARLGGGHRADAADGLIAEIAGDAAALGALLRDPERCAFHWVLRAEAAALAEGRDGVAALERAGHPVREIVVNAVAPPAAGCPACETRAGAERTVLAATAAAFPGRRLRLVPALTREPRGIEALRAFARLLDRAPAPGAIVSMRAPARRAAARPRDPVGGAAGPPSPPASAGSPWWLAALAPPGVRLVVVAGKGGVGKSTTAAALALHAAQADPGRRVLLLSCDPAHSLGDVLDAPLDDAVRAVPGGPANLEARELDADRALDARRARYRQAVDALFEELLRGARLDVAFDRDVVRDLIDLAPPGLDELFALVSVIEALLRPGAEHDLVVLDTAPTGHALRLLRLPEGALEWVHAFLAVLLKYREVLGLGDLAADLVQLARELRGLQALLRDAGRARVLVVTRAAELPARETRRLLQALAGLGLPVPTLLVNAVTAPACARCRRAAAAEARAIRGFGQGGAAPLLLAPDRPAPPRGAAALVEWSAQWRGRQP
jgi:arsenite-transporting ATPase